MSWLPMHSWHPVMVHLPLVGLLLAVAFDLIAVERRSAALRSAATPLWWIGLLGALAAITTGLIAYNRVEHSEAAHQEMVVHRNFALATSSLLLIVAIWRWRRPYSRPAVVLGLVGALGLAAVEYLGGDLVYRYGIGISTVRLEEIAKERGGHHHSEGEEHSHDAKHGVGSGSLRASGRRSRR